MIDWAAYQVGQHRETCPSCGRGPRDRTLGITIDHRGAIAHCFRCEFVENSKSDRHPQRARPQTTAKAREQRSTLSEWGRGLWIACRPISDVAQAYLEARACVIPPPDGHLRWHPRVTHRPTGYVGPALVALVTNAVTGEAMTLHRTWIRADGKKADVAPARMLLGGHRKAGGVVRLCPDEAIVHGLGVGEGIETALALAHAHQPVWAAIDAGNLSKFAVLPGIETLLIAADHDPAGIAAAHVCARRWTEAGREVRVVLPTAEGSDLNDMARAAA